MGVKSTAARLFGRYVQDKVRRQSRQAVAIQERTRAGLVRRAASTAFGKDHRFAGIRDYESFKAEVPVADYERLRPYVDRITQGEPDILWPGMPIYFAKTSGTTSGTKYIPITKDSIGHFLTASRDALLLYAHQTGNAAFFDGKMIFLQGSPEMEEVGGVATGRLSGIVYHHVPRYLLSNRLPSYESNCIEDWEEKVDRIVGETLDARMTLISGIPPWVAMYFERLLERSGKQTVREVFPDFKLFVHGGVNYRPYREVIENLVGFPIDTIETYPASEGFIAFQDSRNEEGLLLNCAAGIFYEFIPADEVYNEQPTRLSLADVEPGIDYAIILNSNAGLWGYHIGDMVRFTSVDPYRLIVSGRTEHFISAFGEHVIGVEVERAMDAVSRKQGLRVLDFTVAPSRIRDAEVPCHEWYVEFERPPEDLGALAAALDAEMVLQNAYYKDLIDGKILAPLRIIRVQTDGFRAYMKSVGRLGGQNKLPRLANDRRIVDAMQNFVVKQTTGTS